jgi:hypothetical protein
MASEHGLVGMPSWSPAIKSDLPGRALAYHNNESLLP